MSEEQDLAKQTVHTAQVKQPLVVNHFARIVEKRDLSHAYLFSGENGSGKMVVALMTAMAMFCPNVKDGIPCGHCNECLRIASRQHPDVVVVEPTGRNIKIDQVRLLKSEFSKSAVEGNQKMFIIDGADKMTTEAANSLLKFIEEPVGNVFSFLLTNNKLSILPTILSRTQVVEFTSLSSAVFDHELAQMGVEHNQFNLIATMTNNLQTVKRWNEEHWFTKLQAVVANWFHDLTQGKYQAFVLIQTDMMPLLNTHEEHLIALNMMIQAWRDVLDFKFKTVDKTLLKFPENYSTIQQLTQRITTRQLLKIMNLMLANNVYLEHNVNFQNIAEAVTLKTLSIINK